MTVLPHSETVRALYALSERGMLGPADVLDAIRAAPPDGAPPEPDELADLFERIESRAAGDAPNGAAPPGWQWTAAVLGIVLRLALDGEPVPLLWQTLAIARMVHAHAWHVDRYGRDDADDLRTRYLDAVARLIVVSEPVERERGLLGSVSVVQPEPATLGQRIRRRRRDLGLTQDGLAHVLGVDRTTVLRWEHDERVPSYPQRDALAAVLGGTPASYDRRAQP